MPRIGFGVDQLFLGLIHGRSTKFCRVMPPPAGGEGPQGRLNRQEADQLNADVVRASEGAVGPWRRAFPAVDQPDRALA